MGVGFIKIQKPGMRLVWELIKKKMKPCFSIVKVRKACRCIKEILRKGLGFVRVNTPAIFSEHLQDTGFVPNDLCGIIDFIEYRLDFKRCSMI